MFYLTFALLKLAGWLGENFVHSLMLLSTKKLEKDAI